MTSRAFRERLLKRARNANVFIARESADLLEAYYRLLARWTTKINLTAFSLDELSDQAVDRLLIEPLAASRFAADSADAALSWFDLGSGSGSPAIPLKIVRPAMRLTMVESKARKAAFLHEAVRTLELSNTVVEHVRMEYLADRPEVQGTAELVTARAVRVDAVLFEAAAKLLDSTGRLFLFATEPPRLPSATRFSISEVVRLTTSSSTQLVILHRR